MKKKKYRTSAEKTGFSWVLARMLSRYVKQMWSSESADPWWMAVKGAQWDRVGIAKCRRSFINYSVKTM